MLAVRALLLLAVSAAAAAAAAAQGAAAQNLNENLQQQAVAKGVLDDEAIWALDAAPRDG